MSTSDRALPSLRTAYILCGGKSSRFGESKALVQVDQEPQLVRLANQLQSDRWRVVAVSQQLGEFDSLGVRTIQDVQPDQGPLAGILAGLVDLQANLPDGSLRMESPKRPSSELSLASNSVDAGWAMFLTCDLWLWEPAWSVRLVPTLIPSGDAQSVLHYFHDGTSHGGFTPFPCAIHAEATATVQQAYNSGIRSMRKLIAVLKDLARGVDVDGVNPPRSFNTQEELWALMQADR